MTENEVSAWVFLTATSFILAMCMISLALGNIVTLGKNITQIDMLKGTFKMTDKDGTHPNPYNLGFLTNLANHFEG